MEMHSWIISNCRISRKHQDVPWSYTFVFAISLLWYSRNCALKDAAAEAVRLNQNCVQFEIDSIELFRSMLATDQKQVQWKIRPVVRDIQEFLHKIPQKEILHVKRGANLTADWFHRQARKGMSCAAFHQHPPSSLTGIWNKDGVPAPPFLFLK